MNHSLRPAGTAGIAVAALGLAASISAPAIVQTHQAGMLPDSVIDNSCND